MATTEWVGEPRVVGTSSNSVPLATSSLEAKRNGAKIEPAGTLGSSSERYTQRPRLRAPACRISGTQSVNSQTAPSGIRSRARSEFSPRISLRIEVRVAI